MKVFFALLVSLVALQLSAQKKELDHTVYDSWQSIKETVIQPQGAWVCYTVNPQEGDATLVIKNISTGNEINIARGAAPQFSDNGIYVLAKIKPYFSDTRKAKIDKKKTEEMPKDSLLIFNTLTQVVQKIANVKSFQLPEKGNNFLAYLLDKKTDFIKEGSDLIIRNLNTTEEKKLVNVTQYAMHPLGTYVAISKLKTKQEPAQIILYHTSDSVRTILNNRFNSATGLVWDELGNQLAYLIEKDSTDKSLQKNYTLAFYNFKTDSALFVIEKNSPSFPLKYTIGPDRKISFSKSGKVIELGIQPILPIKDTSLPEFERVSVDIWHYADPLLQTIQLKNADRILKSTETILYRPSTQQLTYLGQLKSTDVNLTKEGDGNIAYAISDSAYSIASQWQGYSLKDIYSINTLDASKKLIQKGWKGSLLSTSYDGLKLVYYDEVNQQYKAHNAALGVQKVIAKDIRFKLFDEENDVPDDPNAYGIVKWMDDNQHFILYDHFDLWLVDVEGKNPSVQLTNGRKNKISYRFYETDMERKTFAKNSSILLKGFNENDKSESIAILNLATKNLFAVQQAPMHFTTISASKYSNDFIMMQEDEVKSPNLYHYKINTVKQSPIAFTNINQQQADYNWMSTQIFKWKSYTGKNTEGILYLPENFNASKKYPMIVYFYERNNQTLHNYNAPSPTPSRLNIPFFVSRGYVVFVPDIWYQKGYPGQGAYDYIVSGTRALIQKGFIDSTKIGLQGQSWGGYQIAYLITKTNLYAAAWAGAPVVNMTSAYGGIRWGSGLTRQFQYEKTQSRIGASLWERPDLYIKNSPLFSLPNVKTPLVIMSNDADDAVPWYQGIEMFTAMRRLDKKVWLLVYNNEAHNLVERKNRKDIQIREQQFFDSYLKGAPMPTWLKSGVPTIMKGRTLGL